MSTALIGQPDRHGQPIAWGNRYLLNIFDRSIK